MKIKEKAFGILKQSISSVVNFFTKQEMPTKTALSKLDLAEIFIALLPMAIFGSLIFGFKAVLVLLVSVILSVGLDALWSLIIKKEKRIDYSTAIIGLLMGLTLSSRLNILLIVVLNIILIILRKTVFKNNGIRFTTCLLLSRFILEVVFYKAFTSYAIPFVGGVGRIPVDSFFFSYSYVEPAKYLFFGIHSGNIGDTSILFALLGGVYLMLRGVINPIIPASFIFSSAVLALIFGQDLAISLLGGGIFFAAFFLTFDYSFRKSSRIKKILYGAACAVLTFIIRAVLKTEGVYLAMLIADIIFIYVTRKNIKALIGFIKKPDFKKLLNRFKMAFSV
ncbi:MAG: RnfABCDGE type electron transport complex subunit D [Clostridia bacterium]|nr:RnfABCDGE type electron transport complex subunit D [Clostridia bacterium]